MKFNRESFRRPIMAASSVIVALCMLAGGFFWVGGTHADPPRNSTPGLPDLEPIPDSTPFQFDDDCECECEEEWQTQKIYCDVIDGTIHLRTTDDSERVFVAQVQTGAGMDFDYTYEIWVIHSDMSVEFFEFTYKEILVSKGLWEEPVFNSITLPDLSIKTECGDDIVMNTTASNAYVELGEGDDMYSGGAREDIVRGGCGMDLIYGGRGRDMISGDAGFDTLMGGSPAPGVFTAPGFFDWGLYFLDPYGDQDGEVDILDGGVDGDVDHFVIETFIHPVAGQLALDAPVNFDVGTDVHTLAP